MKKSLKTRAASILMVAAMMLTMISAVGCGSSIDSATEARNGVVRVYSTLGTGSAFGIGTVGESTTTFITNRHVVAEENSDGSYSAVSRVYLVTDDSSYSLTYYYYENGGDYYLYDYDIDVVTERMTICEVVYVSQEYDFAIIEAVSDVDRVALELADSAEDYSVGDTIYAIGYPGATDNSSSTSEVEATSKTGTVDGVTVNLYSQTKTMPSTVDAATTTSGVISRFTTMSGRNDTLIIQHDATIHGGNSGGPLVSSEGVVLGINTWSAADSSGDEVSGINYSIYIDLVEDVLDELDIPYNVTAAGISTPVIIGIVAGVIALLVIVVVAVLLIGGKSPKEEQQADQPVNPTPDPTPIVNPTPQPIPQPTPIINPSPMPPMPDQADPNDTGFRVQGVNGAYAGRRIAIIGKVQFGRDEQINQIPYTAATKGISRMHCVIYVVNGQVYLMDLGSSYGTYLGNGQKLMPKQPIPVKPGDKFYLATQSEMYMVVRRGGQI